MARHFARITQEDLEAKIEEAWKKHEDYNDGHMMSIRTLTLQIEKDLKVRFDLENCDYETERGTNLIGYQTLPNGFTFLGCSAGGDWEWPVFFLIYFDGKKLRAYVPSDGNHWNADTHQAYGNDPEADYKNIKKRWPDRFADVEDESDLDDPSDYLPERDDKAMVADIEQRITEK